MRKLTHRSQRGPWTVEVGPRGQFAVPVALTKVVGLATGQGMTFTVEEDGFSARIKAPTNV